MLALPAEDNDLSQQDLEQRLEAYQRFLHLSISANENNDVEESLRFLKAAYELQPHSADAASNYASALQRVGEALIMQIDNPSASLQGVYEPMEDEQGEAGEHDHHPPPPPEEEELPAVDLYSSEFKTELQRQADLLADGSSHIMQAAELYERAALTALWELRVRQWERNTAVAEGSLKLEPVDLAYMGIEGGVGSIAPPHVAGEPPLTTEGDDSFEQEETPGAGALPVKAVDDGGKPLLPRFFNAEDSVRVLESAASGLASCLSLLSSELGKPASPQQTKLIAVGSSFAFDLQTRSRMFPRHNGRAQWVDVEAWELPATMKEHPMLEEFSRRPSSILQLPHAPQVALLLTSTDRSPPSQAEQAATSEVHAQADQPSKSDAAIESDVKQLLGATSPAAIFANAEQLFEKGQYRAAVQLLCTRQELLRLHLTAQELASGAVEEYRVRQIATAIKVCGAVAVSNAVPADDIRATHDAHAKLFAARMDKLTDQEKSDAKPAFEKTDFYKRQPGRYELPLPLRAPFNSSSVLRAQTLLPALRQVLDAGGRLEIDTFSVVTSLPGTEAQRWHRDAGHLFSRREIGGRHLPAHGVVAFFPLHQVSQELGPTGVILGSHIACHVHEERQTTFADGSTARLCSQFALVDSVFSGTGVEGDVLLFDFRVHHRGGANTDDQQARSQLYIQYFREWFQDAVNTQLRQTRQFDSLAPYTRKLLTRLDSRKYMLAAERELRRAGGDPKALQSKYRFRRYNMAETEEDFSDWGGRAATQQGFQGPRATGVGDSSE